MRILRVTLLLLLWDAPAAAQQPQAAVVPQSITVGDVFHAAVRIALPERSDVIAPDSMPLPADLELAGRRDVRYDTAGGVRTATVLYPLTAWRPGDYDLPALSLRIIGDGSDRALTVRLPSFSVRSVLPADTTNIEPKNAKDVLGANRLWWPILLALLLALLLAMALYLWWRRRRGEPAPAIVPAIPPREAALAQLAALEREGLLERGEVRRYYERLTETLRHYAAAIEPQWSVDLTTTELSHRARSNGRITDAVELLRVLGAGDLVKFARARPQVDSARRDLSAARAWIERATELPAAEKQRAA